ncbi:hypothetical protein ACXX9E_29010 [Pseudomonas sp. GNP014]
MVKKFIIALIMGTITFQSKLKDSTIKKILNLCSKNKKKDHRERLAGDIKNEYLIDEKKIQDILEPYLYALKMLINIGIIQIVTQLPLQQHGLII